MSTPSPRPPSQVATRTGSRTGSRGTPRLPPSGTPSSISSQPLSMEEHQREVSSVVSQVTHLLQRRLVQHENEFQEVLVAHTPPQHQQRPQQQPFSTQQQQHVTSIPIVTSHVPKRPPSPSAAPRNNNTSSKSPGRRSLEQQHHQRGGGDLLEDFMPGSEMILGEDSLDSPEGGGGAAAASTLKVRRSKGEGTQNDDGSPLTMPTTKGGKGNIVQVLATSKSPALSALSMMEMSGPSVISVPTHAVTHVSGTGRLDSGGSTHYGHMATGAPTVRLSPSASGLVFPSGQALVQQIIEDESTHFLRRSTSNGSITGSPPALRRASPIAAASPAGRNGSFTALPPALQSLSPPVPGMQSPPLPPPHPQAEKWKHRVSHIAGPVQLGSKDTLFGVRNEIEMMHKQHPADAKALHKELEQTTDDLIGAFAVINDKEYKKDTEELKEQIRRTDQQIEAEVAQHNKMLDLLETAVTMLDAAATDESSRAEEQDSVEVLRKKLDGEHDEVAKKKVALKLFVALSRLKVSKEKVVAIQAAEVKNTAPPEDVRDALLQQAKEAALSVGVHLDREARRKQTSTTHAAPLDISALSQKSADSAGTKQGGGLMSSTSPRSALTTEDNDDDLSSSTSSTMGASYNTMARRMSSFRRGNPAAAAAVAGTSGAASKLGGSVSSGQPRGLPNAQGSPTMNQSSSSQRRYSNSNAGGHGDDDAALANSMSMSMSAAHGSPLAAVGKRNSSSSAAGGGGAGGGGLPKSLGFKTVPRVPRVASNLSIKSPAASLTQQSTFNDLLDNSYLNNQVYTSAQRMETSQLLSSSGITLRSQAEAAIAAAEADYAKRVERENAQRTRLENRTMDQILRDAIDNRAPSPIRHILKEDLDEIVREGQAALSLADQMEMLSKQTADSAQLREELLGKAKRPLMAELRELEERVMRNTASLHTAHQDRKLLVKQYWQWRHRVELGDVKAGTTFEEELSRGPRFRHVGVQNVIQTEYLSQQVQWLKQLLRREETFRRHVARIETLVNELKEMNHQVDYSLTCPVCRRMCVDPVALWPCGHSFCQGACMDSLQVSTYLHRCAVCFSVGSEGAIPNVLLAEIVAKWTVKEKSYSNVSHSLDDVKTHMALFERDKVQQRLNALEFRARQVLNIGYCT